MLKIVEAEVMIGGEGFTQRRGAAQVNTRDLYQVVAGFKISSVEYVERKWKEGKLRRGKDKEGIKQIGENFQGLRVPPRWIRVCHGRPKSAGIFHNTKCC